MLHLLETNRAHSVLCADEQGLGKTVEASVAAWAMDLRRVLIVCPAIARLNWQDEINLWRPDCSWGADVLLENKDLNTIKWDILEWLIVSYNATIDLQVLSKLVSFKWDMIIFDEVHRCVEEHTLIYTPRGQVAIRDLKVGEKVYSISDNGLTISRIAEKHIGDVGEAWVELLLDDGTCLTALSTHPILTDCGWRACGEIQVSDTVQVVRQKVGRTVPIVGSFTKVLQLALRNILSHAYRGRARTNAESEPYVRSEMSSANAKHLETDRTQTCNSRRQRSRNDASAAQDDEDIASGVSAAHCSRRIHNYFRCAQNWISELLSRRLCCSRFVCSDRGRRSITRIIITTTPGSQKRKDVTFARVAGVTVHKCGSAREAGLRFIDLSLSENFNYIANGIVVHNCKNYKAQTTRACLIDLWECAKYKILLTGTPMTVSGADMFTYCKKCAPKEFTEDYLTFAQQYTHARNTGFGIRYVGLRNGEELGERIRKTFFFRRTKEEVLPELPPKTWCRVSLPLKYSVLPRGQNDAEKLLAEVHTVVQALESGRDPYIPASLAEHRRLQGEKKVPAVVEFCKNLLSEDVPLVVFAHHKSVIRALEKKLNNFRPAVITGATSARKRRAAVRDFQEGRTNLIILNMVAGGVAITLTRANIGVYAELDYSAATMSQSSDRLHRIGTKKPVTLYYFAVKQSIDLRIANAVMSRLRKFNAVYQDQNTLKETRHGY